MKAIAGYLSSATAAGIASSVRRACLAGTDTFLLSPPFGRPRVRAAPCSGPRAARDVPAHIQPSRERCVGCVFRLGEVGW